MSSFILPQYAQMTEGNYGLDVIARHNAAQATSDAKPSQAAIASDLHSQHVFPYQLGDAESTLDFLGDGVRTRSGRPTRKSDSPGSVSRARVSKSPAARTRRDRKLKLDKAKTPKITAPLSVLTKDMNVPLKDTNAWVHRSAEVRRQETERRNGYVTRPMNSFMLYRSAYAERTKQWCLQNNHQVVSSVSGESWPIELPAVRDQFNEWARVERANHQAAHPDYKFSPSKVTNKRRKANDSEDDGDGASGFDTDPDAEYRAPKNARSRRKARSITPGLEVPVGFETQPYYGIEAAAYDTPQAGHMNNARGPPTNAAYDSSGYIYDMGQLMPLSLYQHNPYIFPSQATSALPTSAPNALAQHTVGDYGIPGGQQMTLEELFPRSAADTPISYKVFTHSPPPVIDFKPNLGGHGERRFLAQQQQQQQQHPTFMSEQKPPFHYHQSAVSRPHTAIDPLLSEGGMITSPNGLNFDHADNHFENAINGMEAGGLSDCSQYHYANSTINPAHTRIV